MVVRYQKMSRIIIASTVLAVSFSIALWMGYGAMASGISCPVMMDGSLCPMNVVEHANMWQNLFAAVLPNFMIVAFVAWFFVQVRLRRFSFSSIKEAVRQVKQRFRYRDIFQKLFGDLLQALSSGIIQPKEYEQAAL